LSLPEHYGKWDHAWVVVGNVAGWILVGVGLAGFVVGFIGRRFRLLRKIPIDPTGEHRGEWVFVGFFLVFSGILLIAGVHAAEGGFDFGQGQRMALGVGGAAMVGFVFAATQLTTMRVAASVPVVLLLVGMTTWPDAKTLVDPGIQKALITWMGVILGVNGVAEAANQIGVTQARKTARDVRSAPGDLAPPDDAS
jgi:hypothetical protein